MRAPGYGILLNTKDPVHPVRLDAASDSNFAFWHSATFTNDASKILFTDEWGGGTQPKCRATDPIDWGADAILTLQNGKLHQQGYFKMPAAQTPQENCVAHNGMLVPVPGRDIMVQGWYQGGISVFDFTDPAHPKEIAYFDRGPVDAVEDGDRRLLGRLLVQRLHLRLGDRARARRLQAHADRGPLAERDRRGEPRALRPAQPAEPAARDVARRSSWWRARIVDQLVRGNGLPVARTTAISAELKRAESASGAARASALQRLAGQLDSDAAGSSDATRVKALADVVRRIK